MTALVETALARLLDQLAELVKEAVLAIRAARLRDERRDRAGS